MIHRLTHLLRIIGIMAFATPAFANVTIGGPAPDFTATTTQGEPFSIRANQGKIIVLEWTNHLCPFVRKHYESKNMQQLQKAATDDGVVWVSIISSAPGNQGHLTAAEANEVAKERGASPTHIILDEKGAVGHMYGAKTTPHIFIIDKDGKLAYMGAIDDKPTADPKDLAGATNYVTTALAALKAGTPVEPSSTQSYGCSVKY